MNSESSTIADWLTAIDYTSRQNTYLSYHQPGTGQWFLKSKEFSTWVEKTQQTLFCPGILGAGKTILTSIMVDHLLRRFQNNKAICVAYLYCDTRLDNERRVENLFLSILKQLIQGRRSLPKRVVSLYNSCIARSSRPSSDEISNVIDSVIATYSRVFIVIDALDECQPHCRLKLLSVLFPILEKRSLNLFVTSKFASEVHEKFRSGAILEVRARPADIEAYIRDRIVKLPNFVQENQQLQGEIVSQVSSAVGGMFLLARIYLDSLEDKASEESMTVALQNLPKPAPDSEEDYIRELNQAYIGVVERINDQRKDFRKLAKQILSWLTFAKRPLSLKQVRHALAVEVGNTVLDEESFVKISSIISVCAGLVIVREEDQVIHLAHLTTGEFLKAHWCLLDLQERITTTVTPSKLHQSLLNTQRYIALVCITYLSFDTMKTGPASTGQEMVLRLNSYPFYEYAICYWGRHARAASLAKDPRIIDLVENEAVSTFAAQVQRHLYHDQLLTQEGYFIKSKPSPLHLCTYFGLKDTVAALLRRGHYSKPLCSLGKTPLFYAAREGHADIVRLFLEANGLEPELGNGWVCRVLSEAVYYGHEEVVQLLCSTGYVKPPSRGLGGRTPLGVAAAHGHVGVALALLRHGFDPNEKCLYNDWHTPLWNAMCSHHDGMVRVIKDYGGELSPMEVKTVSDLVGQARNPFPVYTPYRP